MKFNGTILLDCYARFCAYFRKKISIFVDYNLYTFLGDQKMNLKFKTYHRIIAMVLAFTIVFPLIPFKYIDMEFRHYAVEI